MTLEELKENLLNIDCDTYDYGQNYNDIWNTISEYENENQTYDFENIIYDYGIVTYDEAEESAKAELEDGGLLRLYYFLGDTCFYDEDLFRINAYGNLENVNPDTFKGLISDLIDAIDYKLK